MVDINYNMYDNNYINYESLLKDQNLLHNHDV